MGPDQRFEASVLGVPIGWKSVFCPAASLVSLVLGRPLGRPALTLRRGAGD